MISCLTVQYLFRFFIFVLVCKSCCFAKTPKKCSGGPVGLKYVWGDALSDPEDCIGFNNMPYPSAAISGSFKNLWSGNSRSGRSGFHQNLVEDPQLTREILLNNYKMSHRNMTIAHSRNERSFTSDKMCGTPTRLCKTRYNTTAPMYGISLTNGKPVTIVQKFPDLLQQVVFEVCESTECDLIHGKCTQTYVPYLFLVIPLGPVTLTGQDYVLVESGCVCTPKNLLRGSIADESSVVPHV